MNIRVSYLSCKEIGKCNTKTKIRFYLVLKNITFAYHGLKGTLLVKIPFEKKNVLHSKKVFKELAKMNCEGLKNTQKDIP